MQSISTNNLFMHGHENWGGGQATLLAPPTRKSEGAIAHLRFRGLCNADCSIF